MKIYRNLLLITVLVLGSTACEDTLRELNENPNEPEEVSAAVLMTSATRGTMNSMVTESFLLSNNIAQITAKTLRSEVDVYNWNAFSTFWSEQYRQLADFEDAAQRAAAEGDAATEGAAVVLKSWIYASLTMAYGDIPYREAIKGVSGGNFTPAYDLQQDIFNGPGGLLDELQRAASLLEQAAADGQSVRGDLIYNGSAMQWQKLANALQLRLLLHLSLKQDVSTEMQALLNEPLLDGNQDNATLEYLGSFPNDYPLFPLKQGDFDAVVMSESAVNALRNTDDPRLGRYARPNNIETLEVEDDPNAQYSGANNGSENASLCVKDGSRLGLRYYDYPGHITGQERADGIIMTYSEQELILSEAAQRGIAGSSPGDHYRSGIEAAMDYYNVSYSAFGWTDFDDFYNNSGVAYGNDLNQIWEQKWLAVFFHGMEPFFEVRRMVYEANTGSNFGLTNIPFLTAPCENLNNDELPVRFLYPGNEQSLNGENYSTAVQNLGGSNSQNARMWLVNN